MYSTTPNEKSTIDALWRLEKLILETLDFKDVVEKTVNTILVELGYLGLGYRIVVLSLYDKNTASLKRISLSETKEAAETLRVSTIPFHEIAIPLTAYENYCVKAFHSLTPQITHEWKDILSPPLEPEDARVNQKAAGIKTSMVYPVISKGQAIGVLIFSMVKDESEVSDAEKDLIRSFTDIVGLAVQNAQLYSSVEEQKRQLDSANERLKQLDKLKDDFVSVASHELRTPMTAIKSYLWMALHKKKAELSPELEKYLDRAYVSVDRLITLVNDMLNVSRIEEGRIELKLASTDLVALAKEVKEEVQVKADEKHLQVNVDEASIPQVLCDKDKIHEVFLNLVGNSLKFTPENGSITMKFSQLDDQVKVDVVDTGRGIAPEDLPRLFAKFGRLANSYVAMAESSGTGLGLYITKSIVELHKGNVMGTSEGIDKGATFSFTLPIVDTDLARKLVAEAPKAVGEVKNLEKTVIT